MEGYSTWCFAQLEASKLTKVRYIYHVSRAESAVSEPFRYRLYFSNPGSLTATGTFSASWAISCVVLCYQETREQSLGCHLQSLYYENIRWVYYFLECFRHAFLKFWRSSSWFTGGPIGPSSFSVLDFWGAWPDQQWNCRPFVVWHYYLLHRSQTSTVPHL